MASVDRFLQFALQQGASDIHIATGSPPVLRINGDLTRIRHPALSAAETEDLVLGFLSEDQRKVFLDTLDLDLSYEVAQIGRFRVNVLKQRRGYDACFRLLPAGIPTIESLGLPAGLRKLADFHQGLVLVTGPAGCGKTSTLAALVDHVNESRAEHILTIEDPIEFIHPRKKSLINQRQVGLHTRTFASALRAALREDPDVILVGELRDLETMAMAISSAETGHLVLATLHTASAAKTVDRVLDSFPSEQQNQIRAMLADSLRGIVCQQLAKRADGKGRVPIVEILSATPGLATLIREGKTFQIPTIMQMGRAQGMQSMDQAIEDLLHSGVIAPQTALRHAFDRRKFARLVPSEKPTGD
ncbi:MAG: type IV pilus twitching motility protein PilT [Candidatus Schekmanbacteria bacterium]|nr:type IV pilus twitching motility protein PilT [Candidatus Schekmanbacteria bacterium]